MSTIYRILLPTPLILMLGLAALTILGQGKVQAQELTLNALKDVRKTVGRNILHRVGAGETIFTIAQKYGLAVDHLAFANGLSPTAIEIDPGVALIIPKQRVLPANPPKNGIVLNLPERGLYLFRSGQFDRFIPVSIGDEQGFATPTGQYHIIERIANPTWYPPAWAKDQRPVPPGPQNPLGRYWIGLSLARTGIHGTNEPINIGNSVTHGCIRAYPEAIEALYKDVSVGWPVRIEYETAKLGKDPEGRIKIVTFPDVYHKQNPLKLAAKKLSATPNQKLSALIKLDLGIPMLLERKGSLLEEIKSEGRAL